MSASGNSRARILVVDDDPGAVDALTDILESEGYAVSSARNGQEALDYLRSSPPPAVIMLDLMMPVMNGRQFLEEQKKDPKLAHIPVVVMTAFMSVVDLRAPIILPKPIDVDGLLKIVAQYC